MAKEFTRRTISLDNKTDKALNDIIEMIGDDKISRTSIIEDLLKTFIEKNIIELEKFRAYKKDGEPKWQIQKQ